MSELVGKNVTTGKRNTIQNQDMMPSGNITLPVKQYAFEAVSRGVRDTPLDAGSAGQGSDIGGAGGGNNFATIRNESIPNNDLQKK